MLKKKSFTVQREILAASLVDDEKNEVLQVFGNFICI